MAGANGFQYPYDIPSTLDPWRDSVVEFDGVTAKLLDRDHELEGWIRNHNGIYTPSTVFPAAPNEGELFYETTTDKLWAYDGTNWVEMGRTGAWTTYTPSLQGTAGNPNLGATGSASGRWARFGRTITAEVIFLFSGAGVAAGTGDYRVQLPFTPFLGNNSPCLSGGYLYDGSAGDARLVSAVISNTFGGVPTAYMMGEGTNIVGAAAPWVWADTDEIKVAFSYEALASV